MRPWTSLAAAVVALSSASGCVAYEHVSDFEVKDPRRLTIETSRGAVLLDANGPVRPAPGAHPEVDVTRADSGAIRANRSTIVGRDGEVTVRRNAFELTSERDGLVRVPACLEPTRHGCLKSVRVVTPLDNVRVLRERERPDMFLAVVELALSAALVSGGTVVTRGAPYTSGPVLITAGGILGVVGLVQLLTPSRVTRSIAPR